MDKIYKWFGGRKIFFFFFLLILNTSLLLLSSKWTDGYGWFTAGLYGLIIAGVETQRHTEYRGNCDRDIKKNMDE